MYRSEEIKFERFPEQMKLLAEVALEMKYQVEWIDTWSGYLLKIEDKFFGYGYFSKFPLNSAESRALCKDKVFSYMVLEKNNILVPEGDYFIRFDEKYSAQVEGKGIEEAIAYADQIGYPVFAKPNRLAQGQLCKMIFNSSQLHEHIAGIFERDHIVLIQKLVGGDEYRVVALDGEIILAYQKTPPYIVGDGKSGIEELVYKLKKQHLTVDVDWQMLKDLGRDKEDILKKDERLRLRDNANLKTGGLIERVVDKYPEWLKNLVKKITVTLGARFFGIDLMVEDWKNGKDAVIIEVNSDPGFDEFLAYDREKTIGLLKKLLIESLK